MQTFSMITDGTLAQLPSSKTFFEKPTRPSIEAIIYENGLGSKLSESV